jgi:hypothetical protein
LGQATGGALRSQAVSNRFPSVFRRGLAFLALAMAAASCTGTTVVKDYGPEAKQNFVQACHVDTLIEDHQIVTTTLAPRSTCECIYTAMKDEFQLSWDDLSDYEAAVADAPAGDPPPMPVKLQKSITKCTTAGPSAPKATTTTEEPG